MAINGVRMFSKFIQLKISRPALVYSASTTTTQVIIVLTVIELSQASHTLLKLALCLFVVPGNNDYFTRLVRYGNM